MPLFRCIGKSSRPSCFTRPCGVTKKKRSKVLAYGIAAAVASLAVVCVLFFRVGMRLPLSLFFRVTSLVLLLLSVVLLGRGIAALQEAGVLSAYYLGVPTIEWLGFFPTVQGVAAQVLAVLLGVVLWLRGNHRQEGR